MALYKGHAGHYESDVNSILLLQELRKLSRKKYEQAVHLEMIRTSYE